MNRISRAYKFTSIILLAIIVSHLAVFHFELEEKVLCIGDSNHFHIESIHNSHLENESGIQISDSLSTFGDNYECTDYLLDNHVDEDFAKIKRNIVSRFIQAINLNNQELNKSDISKNLDFNRYINQKYVTEQLPTILFLI